MLFSPGPTEMEKKIREIASMKLPYFRGEEYAALMIELTEDMKYIFQTKRTPLAITSSGMGVMEMAVQNLLDPGDKVVVLNGGTFGEKWVQICKAFQVKVKEIKLQLGRSPDYAALKRSLGKDVKALLVNAHETSTGLLYDLKKIGDLTASKNVLFIVDGISSIGADDFFMDEWNCDCAMVSSNKALACLPGLSFIVFSERAWTVVENLKRGRFYFDARFYMDNISRGMTPFTPAMIVTFQLRERMKIIRKMGLEKYIAKHRARANAFRERMFVSGKFSPFPERQSNAITSIVLPENSRGRDIIHYLKEKYGWYLAPNPTNNEKYLRVSHMGDISIRATIDLAEKIEEACFRRKI